MSNEASSRPARVEFRVLTGNTAGPYWKVLGRPGMPV